MRYGALIRYEIAAFVRNSGAFVFTLLFPLVVYVLLLRSQFGDDPLEVASGMMAFGVMSACFFHLAGILVVHRDSGYLLRIAESDLGLARFFLVLCGAVSIMATLVLLALGAAAVIVGGTTDLPDLTRSAALCMCCAPPLWALGIATAQLLPNTISAQPMLTGIFYSLSFVSGAFLDIDLMRVGDAVVGILPPTLVVSAANSARDSISDALLALAALWLWGVVGLLIARASSRYWTPRAPRD